MTDGVLLSPWIVVDGHCATRVLKGTDPEAIANRRAFIEKTPRILVDGTWVEGPKGSGGGDPQRDGTYGFDSHSRAWCDFQLQLQGYTFEV